MTKLPMRLHHTAYVTKDQEKTRKFYEEVIGLPLTATWCETDMLFGKERTYVHTFYGIGDGGALAFFQFANPKDQARVRPEMPLSPFHHIALHVDAEDPGGNRRAYRQSSGMKAAGDLRTGARLLPLGLCQRPERIDPRVHARRPASRADQHGPAAPMRDQELKRWLAGDHHSNNTYRSA